MTSNGPCSEALSLAEQRHRLRRQLQVQRQLIAQRLEPAPEVDGLYPRSMTMRLLTQRPALTAKLFAGFAALMLGARLFRAITTALAVARIMRYAASSGQKRLPAPQASRND